MLLRANFTDKYLPDVTVDVVLLSVAQDGSLQTLLTRRTNEPHKGLFALPGVFVGRRESLQQSARRALRDKGGLADVFLEQLFTSGEPDRDLRGRIVSVAYFALVPISDIEDRFATAADTQIVRITIPWTGEKGGPVRAIAVNGESVDLAFDHSEIIGGAIKRLRGKLNYTPLGFELLPKKFTLYDLQRIHEAILGRALNKDSFRRRILASGFVEDTKKKQTDTAYRPATLYRFKKGK
jgi:8-oxo-dGTP diphosphatase